MQKHWAVCFFVFGKFIFIRFVTRLILILHLKYFNWNLFIRRRRWIKYNIKSCFKEELV